MTLLRTSLIIDLTITPKSPLAPSRLAVHTRDIERKASAARRENIGTPLFCAAFLKLDRFQRRSCLILCTNTTLLRANA
jgi:hypothetical protein